MLLLLITNICHLYYFRLLPAIYRIFTILSIVNCLLQIDNTTVIDWVFLFCINKALKIDLNDSIVLIPSVFFFFVSICSLFLPNKVALVMHISSLIAYSVFMFVIVNTSLHKYHFSSNDYSNLLPLLFIVECVIRIVCILIKQFNHQMPELMRIILIWAVFKKLTTREKFYTAMMGTNF